MLLGEQLSPMRAKLLHAVKNDEDTARTWTMDVKILYEACGPGRQMVCSHFNRRPVQIAGVG